MTNEERAEARDDADDADNPMGLDNNNNDEDEGEPTIEDEYYFGASPGWISKFMKRHNLGHFKMKGEKGSADYEAIEPWIHDWLTFLHTEYVIKHHKTLKQVISIIVNFDECGFQYKSLPQYSYHGRKEEIRAKKQLEQGLLASLELQPRA